METENPATTIHGSLVQQSLQQSCVPSDDEQKLQLLIRLGSHFWPKDYTPAQAKFLLKDYLEDLNKYRVAEVEHFCRDWRTDVAKKKFPLVAEIISAINQARRDIAEAAQAREHPKIVSRPVFWWMQSKELWKSDWLESQVPPGQMVRDVVGGPLRWPHGVVAEDGADRPF